MEARPDPIAERFRPDQDLVARAQAHMLDTETEAQRYRRQQWEHALGAARVAMDSLRAIWPSERLALGGSADELSRACEAAEDLVISLDALSPTMLGDAVIAVLLGEVTSVEALERRIGSPPAAAGAAEAPMMRTKAQEILAFVCEHPGQYPPDMNGLEGTLDQLVEQGWVQMQTRAGANWPHPTPRALDSFPEFDDLDL